MIRKSILMRSADKVVAYIEKYLPTAGAERREEVLAMFDNMQQFFPHWVIATCPMMHPDLHYISHHAPTLFGYTREIVRDNLSIVKFFDHVHEADQHNLHECFSFAQDHLESLEPAEHATCRIVFYYRYRKADGQSIYLHDEKTTLQLKDASNLYYVMFRDITGEKAFSGVKVEIYNQQHHALQKIKEYKPGGQSILSKREGQLVTLIRQGLSTKEIAWHLNISPHTVRNIKSKLFEKYNVSSSIELLNMTA